jgi:hypothetical protein
MRACGPLHVEFFGGPLDGCSWSTNIEAGDVRGFLTIPISREIVLAAGGEKGSGDHVRSLAHYRLDLVGSECQYLFLGSSKPDSICRIE